MGRRIDRHFMAVYAALEMGSDLVPGNVFSEEAAGACFSLTVNSGPFTMVAAFGHSSIKFDEDSAEIALQSIGGGAVKLLRFENYLLCSLVHKQITETGRQFPFCVLRMYWI